MARPNLTGIYGLPLNRNRPQVPSLTARPAASSPRRALIEAIRDSGRTSPCESVGRGRVNRQPSARPYCGVQASRRSRTTISRLDDPIREPAWIQRFEAWMRARGSSPQTRNHYRSTLRGMYRTALLPAYRGSSGVSVNPFRDIARDTVSERTVTISVEDLRKAGRRQLPRPPGRRHRRPGAEIAIGERARADVERPHRRRVPLHRRPTPQDRDEGEVPRSCPSANS